MIGGEGGAGCVEVGAGGVDVGAGGVDCGSCVCSLVWVGWGRCDG